MAITNHERVSKGLELLKQGMEPFVERELKSYYHNKWFDEAQASLSQQQMNFSGSATKPEWDIAVILTLMWNFWQEVFRQTLGHAERSLVSELQEARNQWAHQRPFSTDDAYRALDSASRLLAAISAPQTDDLEKMKMELLRVRFDEQVRTEKRRVANNVIETQANNYLKPWREVVNPHKDVASGRYQQAEFAADLWQVHLGEGSEEYRKPIEFYRRTFLTLSLQDLLKGALQRLSGVGGDPVIQLQTNFGGGKTHSMLALYHLFSGTQANELLGIDTILKESKVEKIPQVRRVVLVGNKISPGNPVTKPDGTVIHTLWGEIAWQLGGRTAYDRLRADDERATSPGDVLRELFNEYGPCLILIDEWVAYARQLHEESDLPGGSFETHFSFAQVLTESAKLAKSCLLVISLPASESNSTTRNQINDVEVGGERGRAALDRLRNAIGRVETSWRPANAEEGFEIVRRRLFEPLVEREQFVTRDSTAKAFADLYRTQHQEFPPECRDSDYENRLKAAYPIHPEVFDRLYTDWSTLIKFQRTRGVLRLMAVVIYSLWEKGDRSPLILPSNIPIDDSRVQFELTRYLSDNWVPVIEKDVDGPNSLPLRIDGEVPNLGKYSACRRVARTIYLGSAPTAKASNRGLEDRRIKLGCVMPGESPAIYGDALRRLSGTATYLYQDSARYWYSTQPTVTKLADDRAEQLKGDPDAVVQELDIRLRTDLRRMGDFNRIHALPLNSQDVPDDLEARLVVLRIEFPYTKDSESSAITRAKAIFESRGNTPRLYRNTLVFLAVDKTRLTDLDDAIRRYLAWKSILEEREVLNLDPYQVKQAENQMKNTDDAVTARIPEAYQWLLIPSQASPQGSVEWQSFRLTGQEPLAVRASKKLRNDGLLVTGLAGTSLRLEMDRIPLWRGDNVSIKQLVEDFARYTYLPRLKEPAILIDAIRDGLALPSWSHDTFAYAESFDETTERFRGLRCGQSVNISENNLSGLLVKPEPALRQYEEERAATSEIKSYGMVSSEEKVPGKNLSSALEFRDTNVKPTETPKPKRFHGSLVLDSTRVGRDAGRIADEVIAHLVGLVGANVKVTLEIEAEIPDGAPEQVVRTVTENSRTLKFTGGFEKE